MGQIAQIVFGVLFDLYGRLSMRRIGFPLYIIGGIAAALTPNLGVMLAARFVAGMGAPVIAPFLGVAILSVGSWQTVFFTPPLFAVIVFCWSLRLEESLPREQRVSLDWTTIGRSVRKVISNRTFLRYTAITTFLFSALSS